MSKTTTTPRLITLGGAKRHTNSPAGGPREEVDPLLSYKG